MKTVSTAYRNALKGKHQRVILAEFKLGTTTYRICNSDVDIVWSGNTYSASYLGEISDIEMTSTPKVNDVDIEIDTTDGIFSGLILSQNWMNQRLTITRLILDMDGTVLGGDIAFKGLLSDYNLSYGASPKLTLTVSSIWADFEKEAGIRNNTASQQRHYPLDTALDHSAKATKEIYWGKDKPVTSNASTSSGGSSSRFNPSEELP